LQAEFGEDGGFGGALAEDAPDAGEGGKGGGDGLAGVVSGAEAADEVDVADGFLAAAEAAGDFGLLDLGECAELFEEGEGDGLCFGDAEAAGRGFEEGDALGDGDDFFFADALEAGECAGGDGDFELFDGGDGAFLPEESDGFRSEAGDLEHLDEALGDSGCDLVEVGGHPGGEELFDDLLGTRADALDGFELAAAGDLGDVEGCVFQEARDLGERDGLKSGLALEVHERSESGEKVGEIGVDAQGGMVGGRGGFTTESRRGTEDARREMRLSGWAE